MDRISESLLNEFSSDQDITALPEDVRFEHFASYLTVRRHFTETFDTSELVVGKGNDTGIDGIAIIVNGALLTDIEALEENQNGYLDVAFIFIQADRSPSFDSSKMGTFGFGVLDFFRDPPTLKRNEKVAAAAEIMAAIYQRSSKFRGNPICWLYYVTTGKWTGDQNLEARRKAVVDDLMAQGLFREVSFQPVDQEGLQRLFQQTKNAISRDFNFANRTVIPEVPGVTEAYLVACPPTYPQL
jgi:hypothetical protein